MQVTDCGLLVACSAFMQVTVCGLLVACSAFICVLLLELQNIYVRVSDCNRTDHVVREVQLCVCGTIDHVVREVQLCVCVVQLIM